MRGTAEHCDTRIVIRSRSLFALDLPPGFGYREDFITAADEDALVEAIARIQFADFEMRGVVAKRRVAFFGESYGREGAAALPEFLLPLRAKLAEWSGTAPDAFAMALINEYRPGTPIGWHRDAPQYDIVAGLSLLSDCRMKFRRYHPPSAAPLRRQATHELVLERRSAYLMMGESRQEYEHHIPPVAQLRYSITFRTIR